MVIPRSGRSVLAVVVQHLDGHADVLVIGELDINSVSQLRAGIDELISHGHRDLRLNLSALTFCDAGGLGVLVELRTRLQELGGDLTVSHATGIPLRLLTVCRMLDYFKVGEDAHPGNDLQSEEAAHLREITS
jgi:anti-sigma B factor antagonist